MRFKLNHYPATQSIDGKPDFTYCLVSRGMRAMDFLLGFNNDAALVGDLEGRVRTEKRPVHLTSQDWEVGLSNNYLEPEHGYNEEGMPFQNMTGDFRFENGQVKVVRLEGVKPYETFADDASGLSVRAVFLSHLNQWAVAD
jgi:hypothetical protein